MNTDAAASALRRGSIALLIAEYGYFLSHRLDLARAAVADGRRVVVLTRVPPGVTPGSWPGIEVIPVDLPRGMGNPLADLRALRAVVAVLRARRPAILHNVSVKAILIGMLAARIAGVPRVLNAFTGLGALFHSGAPAVRLLRLVLVPWLAWLSRRPGTHALFQNPADQADMVRRGLAHPDRCHRVGGAGVDVARFRPGPEAAGVPVVLFVGRLLLDKGLGEFVAAAESLASAGVAARFEAAGAPDPVNPRSVPAARLAKWQRTSPVKFLGQVEDMAGLLARCHVVCLPSYHEGVPKALLEAAAAGRAVVASDIAGCRVVVEPGASGLLVPVRDPVALAAAIRQLVESPALRQALGARARHLAETRFAAPILNGQVIDIYQRMEQV